MQIWILNPDIFQDLGGDVLIRGILLTTSTSNAVTVSAESIIAFVALLGAIGTLFGIVFAIYRWYLHQQKQTEEIAELKREQQLLTYGILACLDGLKQLHCNGQVSEAQEKISKHLNAQAHKV
jgi:hypothetical protein